MQQWTDKQGVPGIKGNVDGDVFFGTAEQLKQYGYKNPVPVVKVVQTPNEPKVPVQVATTEPAPVTNPMTDPIANPGNTTPTVPTTTPASVTPVTQPIKPSTPPATKPKTHLQIFIEFLRWLIGKK
jgi:hypothetical protein